MPLSSESEFGFKALTNTINNLPETPTVIRSLGIFKPQPQSITYVKLGLYQQQLELVETAPRGVLGKPIKDEYSITDTFECTHLPLYDKVLPSDVQNVLEFGSNNKLKTVAERIGEKLAVMKANHEYTREHLMLGALSGKILDADGDELVNIYTKFGLTRPNLKINLGVDVLANELGRVKRVLKKNIGTGIIQGWICLCSSSFFEGITSHQSVREAWYRFNDAKDYATGFDDEFITNGIRFIVYDHEFKSDLKLADGKAILFPNIVGGFAEYFAPADLNGAVNTIAKPYYAIREEMKLGMGWELHTETNPLPLPMRPATIGDVSFQ